MSAPVQEIPTSVADEAEETERDLPWRVILYNDDVHGFDEVVRQVQKATGADLRSAFLVTLEAHQTGSAACFEGTLEECEKVAGILREIRLQVEIVRVEE